MDRLLKGLAWLMGAACTAIGVGHLVLGIAFVPGERDAGATVDSRERFYGAFFGGYGAAWLWVARQSPVPARAVRLLAGLFFLGGVGRVFSLIAHGRPHWFQEALSVLELGLPPVFFRLTSAKAREAASPAALPSS